ncbi:CubicO group peptidase, beta-lactamase class C family [Chitinophaga sp. CF118]|uniref:serine hydrolase domain-containing protein n=1 Tax=Chitinophaga sp. CF118 TaxID=1884367 RepID=UPI0008F14A4A|nr:serine hydrolase domain-containing protein [Chitinophaga sp. CF118]SFD86273.1 CubicO group peptidase, beta-lactamase class C family [Chitinophaga sp. CF118]
MKKHSLFLSFFFISSLTLAGQDKHAYLKKYFSTLEKNKQFNGSVLVSENGKVIYEKGFGFADFSNKTVNNVNTAFPIASLSKTLTATAILQLVEAKKLNVTDAVTKYLTGFPYPNITLQHLLSHTSGLPPYNAFFDSTRKLHPDTVFTNVDFMRGLTNNTKPLLYEPGSKGNYDNINFIVLALVIENVTGMQYNNYITENILRPAGMTHTMFIPLRLQYTQPVNFPFAYPYLYPHKYSESVIKASQVPFIVNYWSSYNFSGFGDYVSTITDLLKYDKAYYNGCLLNQEIINKAFEPVKLNDGKNNAANFGWGWQIDKDSSFGKVVYHNGNATGHSCILVRNISKHQTIIIFDNIHNNNSQELAFKTLKILNNIKMPLPRKSLAAEYARLLVNKGAIVAREKLFILKADTVHYQLSEDEMNLIGYDFMGGSNNPNPYKFPEEHKYQEALETLKINAELFPNSWNAYDSYGEILLQVGQKETAIKMYKKSIELNPNNTAGQKILEQFLK